MQIQIKKHRIKNRIFLLLIPLSILMFFAVIPITGTAQNHADMVPFSYYKDESRARTFHEVKQAFLEGKQSGNRSHSLAFGNSRASYWVRFPLKKLSVEG